MHHPHGGDAPTPGAVISSSPVKRPALAAQPFDCRGAGVRAKTDTGLTVITISGEIDASNIDDLSCHSPHLGW
jgi:hypothetical protein